jgi:hypothetical protein
VALTYGHRQYLKELALFIVHHHDVCNSETAPSMKITVGGEEYVFLCSAYNPPKEVHAHSQSARQLGRLSHLKLLSLHHLDPAQCSAIDYMTNTVIQAVSMLNSNKQFPSRFVSIHNA